MFLALDPFMSSRRKVPNLTYLVPISTGMLITLPSIHASLSSCGRVGLVPGGVLAKHRDSSDSKQALSKEINEACNNVIIYTGSLHSCKG